MATRARTSWTEPSRDVPVLASPDVLVVGGGSAGVAAAVGATRVGADVMLVEQSPFLGGLASLGLINLLLTMDDGAGTQVVAGLCQDVVDRLDARGDARFPPPHEWNDEDSALVDGWRRWGLIWGKSPEAVRYSVAFDAEAFVDIAFDLLSEAGVRLRLHTWFAGVASHDGRVEAVFVESKSGREAIVPGVVVDATGDGDVLARLGAPIENTPTPPHYWFRVGGVADHAAPGFWFHAIGKGRALVPWGPGPDRVDATDADSLTEALVSSRRSARAMFEGLRSASGWEDAWLDHYAALLGVTESRRLVGDHVLTKEDGDARFADAIARTGHWTRRGVVFDVPYRCLTAPGATNVLASGRCISTTRYVHQATKEIPAAMATGEAAGAAAAMAASGAIDVHDVDVDALRTHLAHQGVIL